MDVLISETCWALNNEIIKQLTSSWSLFIQVYWSACNVLIIIVHFYKTRIFSTLFRKNTHENPSSGSRFLCGETDRHERANSQFRNFTKRLTMRYKLPFNIKTYSYTWFSYTFFLQGEDRLMDIKPKNVTNLFVTINTPPR